MRPIVKQLIRDVGCTRLLHFPSLPSVWCCSLFENMRARPVGCVVSKEYPHRRLLVNALLRGNRCRSPEVRASTQPIAGNVVSSLVSLLYYTALILSRRFGRGSRREVIEPPFSDCGKPFKWMCSGRTGAGEGR